MKALTLILVTFLYVSPSMAVDMNNCLQAIEQLQTQGKNADMDRDLYALLASSIELRCGSLLVSTDQEGLYLRERSYCAEQASSCRVGALRMALENLEYNRNHASRNPLVEGRAYLQSIEDAASAASTASAQ